MLDTVGQRNALLTTIERARNSAVIAYFLHDSAMIADDALPQLYDKLYSLGKRSRIDLFLYTRGGITEVCWRLLSLLREYCDHLGVIVAPRVQGAGALLALGADEIIMGPLSELGGVETVRKHPLLPRDDLGQPVPTTFAEIKSLLQFLSENTAAGGQGPGARGRKAGEGEAQAPASLRLGPLASEMVATLLQQIHPLAIANLHQADTLSRALTRKALNYHLHPEDSSLIEQIVELFNGGFYSPLYTAGRGELQELGLPVTQVEGDLWSSIWGLAQLYQAAIYEERADPARPGVFSRYVCIIEMAGRTTGLRQLFSQVEGQERPLQIGWETAVKGPGPGPSFGPGGLSNN